MPSATLGRHHRAPLHPLVGILATRALASRRAAVSKRAGQATCRSASRMHAAAGRAGRAAAVVALRTRQCLRSTRVLHLGNSEHMAKPTLWAAPRSGSRAELRGQCVAQALLCTAQRPLARVSLRREYRTDEAAEGGAEERRAVGAAARLGGCVRARMAE
eukprot:scaffold20778_cov69-Phaeocystis_antarctica.AAC.3